MSDLPIIGENRRECGHCTACCKPLPVPELDKPANQWCQHCEIGRGCKIYHVRPDSCRRFDCAWLLNPGDLFGDDDRPDRLRVMFTTVASEEVTAPEGIWRAHELTPGALRKRRAQYLISALVHHQRVVMVFGHGGEKRMLFDKRGSAIAVGPGESEEPEESRIIKP